MVKIFIVDWIKYNLHRETTKVIPVKLRCGLSRLLNNMSKYDAGEPYDLTIVINGTKWFHEYDYLKEKYPFIQKIHYRQSNTGRDIGAYNAMYQKLKGNYNGDIVFMNTGVNGPHKNDWLADYKKIFYGHKRNGLSGPAYQSHSINNKQSKFCPHIRSNFLFTNMTILSEVFPNKFPGAEAKTKNGLINHGEIKLSEKVLEKGYAISAKLDDFYYKKGDQWQFNSKGYQYKIEYINHFDRI